MNKKQRIFVEEYLKCWNATEAARRAGYAHPAQMGYQLLHRTSVEKIIADRIKQAAMSADEVLYHISRIATADISSVIEPTGKRTFLIDTDKIKEYGYLIKNIRHTKHGVAVEFYNKLQALQLLGRHLALFTDKVQLDASEELIRMMYEKGLTENDIRSHPLLSELFIASDANIVGVTPDGADSSEEETQ